MLPARNSAESHGFFDLICILTIYATVMFAFAMGARSWGSLHHDMTEAWAWGKEFQLGYAKHPMASAWTAGAWFALMPRTNWSFYLLAIVNAAVGLAGVWMLAGEFLSKHSRTAAIVFLMLTPSYTLWALKFNANSILLSSWPWATYFFVQSLQKRSVFFGLLAGVAGAIALLSKYYSLVLIATLFVAAILHPDRRSYFGSALPYLSALAGLIVITPHLLWLAEVDISPLRYALATTEHPAAQARAYAVLAVFDGYLSLGLGAGAFAFAFGQQYWPLLRRSLSATWQSRTAWIIWLAHGPVLLTIIAYLVANVRITGSYLIPVFFAMPVAFLVCSGAVVSKLVLRRLALAAAGIWLPLVLASPLLASYTFDHARTDDVEPRKELAAAATELWHQLFDRPLRFVAGSYPLATASTFYSSDAPSFVVFADPALSPWARAEQVARDGMLIVCRVSDAACVQYAERLAGTGPWRQVRAFTTSFMGKLSAPQTFAFFILPPADTDRVDRVR